MRLLSFAAVFILLFAPALPAQEPAYDLVIRNGQIVDGTGNPWFHADIAVRGDRIVLVGRVPDKGKKEIDARGRVVSPGFIDMHSHSDLLLLEDGSAPAKIRQGVTTEVFGEGTSAGPSKRFPTLGNYFDTLDKAGIAVNVVSYAGLDSIWKAVLGESFERPTSAQFDRMKEILAAAMKDGAAGLSSMLAMPPGSLATTDDLVELCKVVAKHGGIYSSHIRHEGTDVVAAVKEAIAVGERAGVPVDIIHLKIAEQKLWGRMNELVALIDAARARGVNVQANVYPYTRGNNDLASIIPPWAHEGGTAKMLERLKDNTLRPRLKKEITEGIPGWYNHYTAVGGDWSRMLVSGKGPHEGLTVDRILSTKGKDRDPLDVLFDILVEQGGSIPTVYEHHTEKDMTLALRQPWCSIGSDGSAYSTTGPLRRGSPHPRNFGTFPRVLGVYVREQKVLGLEDAVRKMTSLNAAKIGLADRGTLRAGAFADITIFDAAKVIDRSRYADPFHYPEGIETVIVNGTVAFANGGTHSHETGTNTAEVKFAMEVDDPELPVEFPVLLHYAGLIWIIVGVMCVLAGCLLMIVHFCIGFPVMMLSVAMINVGINTCSRLKNDCSGDALGSIGISFVFFGLSSLVFVKTFAAPGLTVPHAISFALGFIGGLLLLAGILAMLGRKQFLQWREENPLKPNYGGKDGPAEQNP